MMVWACAAKRRQWLGEEMYGVWNGGCQARSQTKENLEIVEEDCQACKLNTEYAMDHSKAIQRLCACVKISGEVSYFVLDRSSGPLTER